MAQDKNLIFYAICVTLACSDGIGCVLGPVICEHEYPSTDQNADDDDKDDDDDDDDDDKDDKDDKDDLDKDDDKDDDKDG